MRKFNMKNELLLFSLGSPPEQGYIITQFKCKALIISDIQRFNIKVNFLFTLRDFLVSQHLNFVMT